MSRVSVVVFCPDGHTDIGFEDVEGLRKSLHMEFVMSNWDGHSAIPFCGALVMTCSREAFESDLAGLYRYTLDEALCTAAERVPA